MLFQFVCRLKDIVLDVSQSILQMLLDQLFLRIFPVIFKLIHPSQQWKHQIDVWNLFKLTIKTPELRWLTSFRCLYCYFWTDFTHCSVVSIVDFKQVNVGWDKTLHLPLCNSFLFSFGHVLNIECFTYNPGQNIWNKIEKSSKTREEKKSLIFTFAFFNAIAKV